MNQIIIPYVRTCRRLQGVVTSIFQILRISSFTVLMSITECQVGLFRQTLFFFGATAPIWALAYLHETLRFTSVF
jgi:hypothetical protein